MKFMKKEKYFTDANIDLRSDSFLEEIKSFSRDRILPDIRANTALLVLDMQDYFLNVNSHAYVPSSGAIIPRITDLIDTFSKNNLPVIMTRHINDAGDSGNMADWWKDMIRADNDLSEINKEIFTPEALLINKRRYDAFHGSELEQKLEALKIRNLIISGVMTHLCCETTARQAFVHDYNVIFPVDSTATYNAEFHRASLINLSHGFAHILKSEKIINILNGDDH